LPAPYDRALRDAVCFILDRFEPLGIVACGTLVHGDPGPSSDLDIYVIHAQPKRQRIQKFFHGVPAEIFVNPVRAIEGYFEAEAKHGRPCTAHMLATGFVVLDRDPVVQELRRRARAILAQPPSLDEAELTWLRYGAALQVEDACDIAPLDPAGASMILNLAVHAMLQYCFRQADRYLPRDKDLLDALREVRPEVAVLAREFYATAPFERRLALAKEIALQTIGVLGFFEWESVPEDV
jgi:predicted nucleotidyltransferase